MPYNLMSGIQSTAKLQNRVLLLEPKFIMFFEDMRNGRTTGEVYS